ncbi:MAG TPA: sodium-extruding oxaloacetate decarboxylase subunit alpha [Thermodesulfobacteriota bacterium]|nr:sodium-extruding oxaloacetate decarboxylase subunit alpha [Thermodesulfobacteriota bacterium]
MKVNITDTTMRDAHQSLMATRLRTADILPAAPDFDRAGFFSLEAWGGATFDSCIRFLNEDPWERLRAFRGKIPNTPLQMLLRGQNLVGYRHYADDVVEEFVRLAIKNGVGIFRIFDALNDIRNMTTAMKAVKRGKAHVQGAICYTISPVHTIEAFVQMGVELEKAGCDSICIKDMAGLITPKAASDLIRGLKKAVHLPISLHSHCTSGLAPLSYEAAVHAGVNVLDTALGPFSGGTSQPPTESVVAALKETDFDTGLDLELLAGISGHFAGLREKYQSLIDPIAQRPDINVLLHQIPGGMLSNLLSQLKEQNQAGKYQDVLKEIPRVRKDLGYPPLVTPTSQIVGTQAVLNVLLGERYKRVSKEVKEYCLGYYGKTPAPIDPDVRKKIIGKEKPITERPADMIKPQLEEMRSEAQRMGILKKEEDLLTYVLYPNAAPKFLKGEVKEELLPTEKPQAQPKPAASQSEFQVDVDGELFNVRIYPVAGVPKIQEITTVPAEKTAAQDRKGAVLSPMGGMILRLLVKAGDQVSKGKPIVLLESMKMEMPIEAPHSGEVKEVFVYESEVINPGDLLMTIQ